MTFDSHELTIKRTAYTQDAAGGAVETTTVANRAGLPRKVKGRAIILKEKEKLEHGVRADYIGWKFLTATDPKIDIIDQIDFDYIDGQSHSVEILTPSRARSADGRFWRTIGQEKSSED